MLIKGAHHVAIRVNGEKILKEEIAFYCDLLGMQLMRSWGQGTDSACTMGIGDLIIEMFANAGENRAVGPIDHIALSTDDVDECIDKVRRAGFKVTVEPMDIEFPPKDRPLKARVAFCEGPAGESVEFFKEI